ncbi:N-acetylglucosamine repressor [Propionicimonas sp. T2.31MG-18]|uniref:ROK family transcriptional regulator n=1 Tax=Propionicimonas sp. T2.31MG-18 TaxID=3157620 RepID=UPI0035ED3ED4
MVAPATAGNEQRRAFRREQVLRLLATLGPLTRVQICSLLELSRGAGAGLVADLLGAGLITESADDPEGRVAGRPPKLLRLAPPQGSFLAVSLGHDAVTVAVADGSGTIRSRQSRPCEHFTPIDTQLATAASLVAGLVADDDDSERTVVVSRLGPAEPIDGLEVLGGRVLVNNDANLAAFGELTFGAGQGARNLLYVRVVTATGGGLVIEGRIHSGSNGHAGDVGHLPIEGGDWLCWCGLVGCAGRVINGDAMVRELREVFPQVTSFADIEKAAAHRVPVVEVFLRRTGRKLGRAIAGLVGVADLDCLVIDGALGSAGAPFIVGVKEALDAYTFPGTSPHLRVELGAFGEGADLHGAIALGIAAATPTPLPAFATTRAFARDMRQLSVT